MDDINLNLTRTEAQYILNVLAQQPFKDSADIINKIVMQSSPKVETQEK